MRPGLWAIAIAISALPAQGEPPVIPSNVVDALTQIDAVPSKSALNDMFASPERALSQLVEIALAPEVDLGIQLRAIRTLTGYCPPPDTVCGEGTVVHDTLFALIDAYPTSPRAPADVLRLRAAAEALGATRSGLNMHVDKLVPLLDHESRDVRATVVRALRNLCNMAAMAPLSQRHQTEPTEQVRLAIIAALSDLRQCNLTPSLMGERPSQ